MSQTPGLPKRTSDDARGPVPTPPLPTFDGTETPEETRRGTVDFSQYIKPSQGGSGGMKPAHVADPGSGGAVISWAELLRHAARAGSEDEVMLGSLPELQIDAVADNEMIKKLQRESGKSGVIHQRASSSSKKLRGDGSTKPPSREIPRPEQMPLTAQAFPVRPVGPDGWLDDVGPGGDSTVDLATAARDAASPISKSGSHPDGDESSVSLAAALRLDDGTSAVNLGMEPQTPGLLSNASLMPVKLHPRPTPAAAPARPARPASRANMNLSQPRRVSPWFGGAVAGLAAAAILGAGLWAAGIVSLQSSAKRPVEAALRTSTPSPMTPDLARRHLELGEPQQALEAFTRCDDSPDVLAGRGQSRWLAYLRQQKVKRAPLAENDAEVAQARKDLVASRSAEGTLWLGLINESFLQFRDAREAYLLGRDNYPDRARLFSAALARLDALSSPERKKVAIRVDPQLGLALVLTMMEAPVEAGGVPAADEAGFDFWEAVSQARNGDFASAREALQRARERHEWRRDFVARRGLNPDSDPRDEIFIHSCDQLLSYWDVRARLQSAGFQPNDRSPAEVIDTLLANQKKYDEAIKSLAASLKTDRLEQVPAALDAIARQRQQAEDKWRQAMDATRRAEESLKGTQAEIAKRDEALTLARGDLAKREDALTALRAEVTRRDDQLVALRKSAEDDLKRALTREAEMRRALDEVSVARKTADASFQEVRARFVNAKLVAAGATPAELVQALDSLLSADSRSKDVEIARLRQLLDRAQKTPQLPEPSLERADPTRAEPLFSEGLQLYYARRYAEAEEALLASLRHNGRDARVLYFLGLTRLPLGKTEAADADFRRAVTLERDGLPDSRDVTVLLERLQGPDRQLINRYRR